MNQLSIINVDGKHFADSREVAEMTEVRHSDLLEKINVYINHLTNGNFRSSDFFHLTNYRDSKGEFRPMYLLTRKGCDMVANKMTGEKGVLFTATYVTKFEEMEKRIANPMPELSPQLQLLINMELKQKELEQATTEIKEAQSQIATAVIDHTFALSNLEQKVTNEITLTTREQAQIQGAVTARVTKLGDRSLYPKLYSALKRHFGVPSYRDLKRSDLTRAFDFIKYWRVG